MMQVVIVGAGPTGAALALLLVKRGIAVTLVEAAKDSYRVFRGEGLMPSGLDAIAQMGLSTMLEGVPHRQIDAWEFVVGDRQLFRVDEPMGSNRPCTLVSQPPLLETLISEAQLHPEFEFIPGVPVKDLLYSNDRIAGVKLGDGREIPAALVIGADGRNSVVRQRAELDLVKQQNSIDVLWFKLAAHPRFVADNVFYAILNGGSAFSIFHGENQEDFIWVGCYLPMTKPIGNTQTGQKLSHRYRLRGWQNISATVPIRSNLRCDYLLWLVAVRAGIDQESYFWGMLHIPCLRSALKELTWRYAM